VRDLVGQVAVVVDDAVVTDVVRLGRRYLSGGGTSFFFIVSFFFT